MHFGNCDKFGWCFMDIVLTRILSLIPKKHDGKFVHGELKEFANKLNLKSGNVVSDWMNGRSTSYTSYVYQIADIYNVSVEWLNVETDDPSIKTAYPTSRRNSTPIVAKIPHTNSEINNYSASFVKCSFRTIRTNDAILRSFSFAASLI